MINLLYKFSVGSILEDVELLESWKFRSKIPEPNKKSSQISKKNVRITMVRD